MSSLFGIGPRILPQDFGFTATAVATPPSAANSATAVSMVGLRPGFGVVLDGEGRHVQQADPSTTPSLRFSG